MSVETSDFNRKGTITPSAVSLAMPSDYFELMKPRVMRLVVFTALVGMVLAPGNIHPVLAVVAIVCIAIGAGASGALNMWYDADIDQRMGRTAKRPIPQGRVSPSEALVFGFTLSAFSVVTMGMLINWASATLLAFTIFFYVVVYSMWLKRSTPQNIVIGGAAGAFPPMIGWAAVSGSFSMESVVLFAIIFLWTPPHFWALALFRLQDYENADVPMMPNVAGEASTRFQSLLYAIPLAFAGMAPTALGFASLVYGFIAAGLGSWFVWLTFKMWREGSRKNGYVHEKRLFKFSLVYLFAIFLALGIDGIAGRMMG